MKITVNFTSPAVVHHNTSPRRTLVSEFFVHGQHELFGSISSTTPESAVSFGSEVSAVSVVVPVSSAPVELAEGAFETGVEC